MLKIVANAIVLAAGITAAYAVGAAVETGAKYVWSKI